MGVAIHSEKENEILRPMVKELAQSDLSLWGYSQKTVNFYHFKEYGQNWQLFGHNSKTVSPIALIPSP